MIAKALKITCDYFLHHHFPKQQFHHTAVWNIIPKPWISVSKANVQYLKYVFLEDIKHLLTSLPRPFYFTLFL